MECKQRIRYNITTLNVRGKSVPVVTVKGLSYFIKKSRDTILRYERSGIFPEALLKVNSTRYYPFSLVKRIAPLVKKFPGNKRPSPELLAEIYIIFNDEREKLCQ